MYNILRKALLATALLGMTTGFTACSDEDAADSVEYAPENSELTVSQYGLLEYYVNDVVISTYSRLATEAIGLMDKVNALEKNRTQSNVDAACDAWRAAREQWELSEAFLFGTASDSEIDPHIDSWPLDNLQLGRLLSSNTFSSVEDPKDRADMLRDAYGNAMMGFHAAEYVLFEGGTSKDVTKITEEEMAYLQASAIVLAEDCVRLKLGWAGEAGLNERESEIVESLPETAEITKNFGEFMLNAGQKGSIYTSFNACIAEILGGCADIIDEVGTAKMEDPIAKNSVLEVESWYSWNSIDDFQNNIRGVRLAYTSNNGAGPSVRDLVRAKDSELDARIMSLMETAINALENIRTQYGSYRQLVAALGSNGHDDANVTAAQEALAELNNALMKAQGLNY